MSFEPGDVVKLKSGGILMVIEEILNDKAKCAWMDNAVPRKETFGIVVLEHYNLPTDGEHYNFISSQDD